MQIGRQNDRTWTPLPNEQPKHRIQAHDFHGHHSSNAPLSHGAMNWQTDNYKTIPEITVKSSFGPKKVIRKIKAANKYAKSLKETLVAHRQSH